MSSIAYIGSATFVPLQNSFSALRSATKRAILSGKAAERYLLVGESFLYQDGHVEQALSSPQHLSEELTELNSSDAPAVKDAIPCVALLSAESGQGALLYCKCGQWQSTYWPLLTPEAVEQEQLCAKALMHLAQNDATFSIDRRLSFAADKQKISQILESLAEILQK